MASCQIPGHARAAVFHAVGKPLSIEAFPLRAPGAGELLAGVDCATLCRSDLHTIQGRRQEPTPTVLGHEMLGRVWQVNTDQPARDAHGIGLRVGDRITWSIMASCGECFYCQRQLPQKCVHLRKYGHCVASSDQPPCGGLSEACLVWPGTTVVRVPESLPDYVACPANCATATAHAALRVAGDCRGQCVLVHGAGMLGLTAVAMAASAGAAAVLATDLSMERLAMARGFGATAAFRWPEEIEALERRLQTQTEGRGADQILDFSGANKPLERSLGWLRIGGCLILVGSAFPAPPLHWSAETLLRKLIRVEGVHNYRPDDLVGAIEFLDRTVDRFPWRDLVSAEYPLDQVNQAVKHAAEGQALRVAVRP